MSQMKEIIENMEAMVRPLMKVERQDPNPEGEPEAAPEAEPEVMDEGISAGAIDRLVDAMFHSPKVDAMLERFGLESRDKANLMMDLRMQITPVIKLSLSKYGQRVAGASQAKAAVRSMAKS